MWGAVCVSFVPFVVVFHRVHLGMCAGSLWLQDLPDGWLWSSGGVSLLLSVLSLCVWCIVFEYALISRF